MSAIKIQKMRPAMSYRARKEIILFITTTGIWSTYLPVIDMTRMSKKKLVVMYVLRMIKV